MHTALIRLTLFCYLFLAVYACAQDPTAAGMTQSEAEYSTAILRAVDDSDREWLAENLAYPLCVEDESDGQRKVENLADFKAISPRVLTDSFLRSVRHAWAKAPVKNWRGVGLAGGLIWFDYVAGGYRIIRANAPGIVDCDGYSGVGEPR